MPLTNSTRKKGVSGTDATKAIKGFVDKLSAKPKKK